MIEPILRQCLPTDYIFMIHHFDLEIISPEETGFLRTHGDGVSFYRLVKFTDKLAFIYLGGTNHGKPWKWGGILHHFVPEGESKDEKMHWLSDLWKTHRARENSLLIPVSTDFGITAFASRMQQEEGKFDVTMVGRSRKQMIRLFNIGEKGFSRDPTPAVVDILKAKWLIERLGGRWPSSVHHSPRWSGIFPQYRAEVDELGRKGEVVDGKRRLPVRAVAAGCLHTHGDPRETLPAITVLTAQ
jgi:hypothetical protein